MNAVILDTGPLGYVTNPRASDVSTRANRWLESIIGSGYDVFIPEIADYEIRRELIRGNRAASLKRLNELEESVEYIPISTATMRKAAELWAEARNAGIQTAHDKALDGDMILCAQAALLGDNDYSVVIATTNVKHLDRFVPAKEWEKIAPLGG